MRYNPTALITGATGGIGEELCREFARHGYDLILTARSPERLQWQALRLHRTYGVEVQCFPCDLRDHRAPEHLCAWLTVQGFEVDVLVNNAGFGAGGRFSAGSAEVQREMLEVNMAAPTRLCHLLLPGMMARDKGHILNIASTGALVPGPMNAVYCASKAYLLSLSEALAVELAGSGIGVTAVCPGATQSGFAHRARMEETLLFRFFVLSPKEVAQAAFAAMQEDRSVYTIGAVNKAVAAAVRFAPRKWSAKASGWVQKQR